MNDQMENARSVSLLRLAVFALAVSGIYTILTYDPGFLSGNGPFWEMQVDDVGTYITGLRYYIRDQWRFPLFYTRTLCYPDGANIIFTDSLPLLAVIAKVLFKFTGVEWNYFGPWFILSNALYAISIVTLLDSFRIRSYAVLGAALLFGFSVFPYLHRTFHIALSSHFLVIFALTLYFRSRHSVMPKKDFIWFLVLLSVCLLVHFYLFILSLLITGSALATLCLKKRVTLKQAVAYVVCAGCIIGGVMYCAGYISFNRSHHYISLGHLGGASMNLLSPVLPVHSPFFAGPFFDDPTGSQFFEGHNYLGLAVVGLCLWLLIGYPKMVRSAVINHPVLALLCGMLFIYSLSNQIYLGPHLILEIPLVPGVETLYKTFKASGRFFWPCVYLATFLPIIMLYKVTASRKLFWVLLLALALMQNIEIWQFRQRIHERTRQSPDSAHLSICESLVQTHGLILVSKEHAIKPGLYRNVTRTLYYLAGEKGKAINYCYTARNPRQYTSLEALLRQHISGDVPLLVVIPSSSAYTEWTHQLPYQMQRDTVIFASNAFDFQGYAEGADH